MSAAVPLAHTGAGATWQALVVVAAAGLAIVFIGVVAGRIQLDGGDDLVLPLAAVAIISSAAPALSESLSDAVTWAMPAGAVVLLALLLATFTPLRLTPRSWLTWATVVVATVLAVALRPTLTENLHPPADALPIGDAVALSVVAPGDGATVPAGGLDLTFRVEGGTFLPQAHDDPQPHPPEQHGRLRILVDGVPADAEPVDECTVASPCTELTSVVEIDRGQRRIVAEFVTQEGLPFTPPVSAILEVIAD